MDADQNYATRKRRRLDEGDSDISTDISQAGSESDGSIQVLGISRRTPEDEENYDDNDDDYECILRALNENEDQNGANRESRDRSSEASTNVNLVEAISSDDESGKESESVEAIDLETELLSQKRENGGTPHKAVRDYRCPICFDPPENATITRCGHTFCASCLFQMVNSSRTSRKSGQCALCRKDVKLQQVKMVVLKKKRVLKKTQET